MFDPLEVHHLSAIRAMEDASIRALNELRDFTEAAGALPSKSRAGCADRPCPRHEPTQSARLSTRRTT